MIEACDLVRRFGPTRALDGVSFAVPRGAVVGLLGPNGAGKTTAERILLGVLAPHSGSVSVAGFDASRDSLEVRRRTGYLPEHTPLYPELRVIELLRYRARLKGLAGRELRSSCAAAIASCGLESVQRRLVGALSRGYRQRVGLADALLGDPPVLILDEPTSGLDPLQRREILGLVRSWRGARTVLLSSHVLPEVEATCDQILLLHQGRLLASGSPDAVRRAGAGRRLALELRPGADPLHLEALAGVERVHRGAPRRAGTECFILECGADSELADSELADSELADSELADSDLAERLFDAVAASGAKLLELREEAETLEEVFVRIVRAGCAEEPRIGAAAIELSTTERDVSVSPCEPTARGARLATLRAIFRRELLNYFRTPLGWGLLFVFHALLGWFFYSRVVATGDEVVRGVSRWAVFQAFGGGDELARLWFLFLPALLTMRLLAEERRTGTLESLLSAPVRIPAVVLGKFLAAWVFLALLWAPGWLFLGFAALQDGRPDWGLASCQYLGLLLLGGVGLAVGLYCSSLFASQVLAGASAVAASMLMALPWLLQSVAGSEIQRRLLEGLDLFAVWDQGLHRGLVDSAHLALFGGLMVLFLGWTWLGLEVRRWR